MTKVKSKALVSMDQGALEIIKAGGIGRLADQAALNARRKVWREYLDELEETAEDIEANPDAYTPIEIAVVRGNIRRMRRRLGIKTTPDPEKRRALTRERVRRFRERQRAANM